MLHLFLCVFLPIILEDVTDVEQVAARYTTLVVHSQLSMLTHFPGLLRVHR